MSYSANDNQNYFVGSGRTTSRVIAQPGGQCSISIGGWTPEELERQRILREQQREAEAQPKPTENEGGNAEPTEETTTAVLAVKEAVIESKSTEEPAVAPRVQTSAKTPAITAKPTGISSNAFASSASTNSFNVITDRPTSRVSRPPGGHCSIVLG